mmetsp:Transcript_33636/g.72915  ORF Transcript_33636/g.72915 Transcript_33636/m.72915 type:complete len:162 (-) Transcript_33636:46-531(-)
MSMNSQGHRSLANRGRTSPAGDVSWDWCIPKERRPLVAKIPEGPPAPARTLQSSPCFLSKEGQASAQRMLCVFDFPAAPERATAEGTSAISAKKLLKTEGTSSLTLLDAAKIPKTCNQMYGSQAPEAERKTKFVPKSSSEMSLFVDSAFKSMTPYNASIRF